jgi:hypothetical protein
VEFRNGQFKFDGFVSKQIPRLVFDRQSHGFPNREQRQHGREQDNKCIPERQAKSEGFVYLLPQDWPRKWHQGVRCRHADTEELDQQTTWVHVALPAVESSLPAISSPCYWRWTYW